MRIKENKEVYEGEVTEITPEESASSGYGKVLQFVVVGLKTVKGTKQLKLDPTIYDSILKEKVQVRNKPPQSIVRTHRENHSFRPTTTHTSFLTLLLKTN